MKSLIYICILIVIGVLVSYDSNANASSDCSNVQMVFARGSGQDLGDEDWDRFNNQIESRLNHTSISYQKYELGTVAYNSYQYPAVPIKDTWVKLGAKISAGHGYEYGESILKGVLELYYYLKQQHAQCPSTQFILGGYSQGAQVVGDTLQLIPEETRTKIAFTALFGDPKLYLPEGEGLPAPACLNWNLSSWRRSVENCYTSAGILGSRKPYIPDDMKDKVGLWCLAQDYVCGSTNLPWEVSGHSKYKEPNSSIDQAAQEIAQKLKTAFTYQSHLGKINTAPDTSKPPSANVDVLFVVDRTVGMQEDYVDYFLPKMRKIADKIGPHANISFDLYMGCWHRRQDKESVQQGFSELSFPSYQQWQKASNSEMNWTNADAIGELYGLEYFPIEANCDLSWELGTHIQRAINNRSQYYSRPSRGGGTIWPEENTTARIIIPVTNTPYAPGNNSPLGTHSLYTQATSSLETVIYPLAPDNIRNSFKELEELDGSKVRLVDDEVVGESILDTFGTSPQLDARLTNVDYQVPPGSTVTFNASPSIVSDDTIVIYEWDFNNDTSIDATTTQPTASHTYSIAPYNNTMTVKITTATGLVDTASARVQVQNPTDLPPTPLAPVNLKLEPTSSNSVLFSWQARDDLIDKWLVYLNDIPLGYMEKNQTSIEITDIRANKDNTFGIRAVSSEFQMSEISTVALPLRESMPSLDNAASSHGSTSKFSPATNILEAFTKIGERSGMLPINDSQLNPRKPSVILIYYIVGGVVVISLLFLVGFRLYKRRQSSK